jgi:hypothetical protein
MNTRLIESLSRFISRANASGCHGHVSPVADLAAFDERFPGVMPSWYREVLQTAPIADITFIPKDPNFGCNPFGHFRDAATQLVEIDGVEPDERLSIHGYLAIGAAGNGDCWVVRSSSNAEEPVFLCESSAYGPGAPSDSPKCLLMHSESFAAFLDEIIPDPDAV